MEDKFKYENREQLYKFLLDDWEMLKIEEKYDHQRFGNFLITLSSKNFLLRYVKDRGYLNIEISGKINPLNWYALSFIKNFIEKKELNPVQSELSNVDKIVM